MFSQRNMLHRYIVALTVAFIPFLFWIPTLQKQILTASNLISVWPGWKTVSGVPFLKFPFLLLAKFIVGATSPGRMIYGLAVAIVGIIFILSLFKIANEISRWKIEDGKKNSPPNYQLLTTNYFLLFCYFFIPILIAWISGLWISANGPWRLLFVLPAFYGIFATQPVFGKKIRMALVVILLVINVAFSFYYLFFPKNYRENWKEAIKYSDLKIKESGGVVLSEYIDPWAPMVWYSKYPKKYIGASTTQQITENSVSKKLDTTLNTRSQILLYTYLCQISDPHRFVESRLNSKKYKISEEKDFRGVGIIKTFSR